jgi:hypothetical protein
VVGSGNFYRKACSSSYWLQLGGCGSQKWYRGRQGHWERVDDAKEVATPLTARILVRLQQKDEL